MQEFIQQIVKNLESNGFPSKKVSLPTEKMYEIADKKGLSLNKVLDEMQESMAISFDIGDDKIVFEKITESPQDMKAKAEQMMRDMDPVELENIKNAFMQMSPSEKEEIMKKGREMGLL